MGGLSRKSAYIQTLRNNDINPIILDAGDALFKQLRFPEDKEASELFKAESFLKGMETIGCDALNIGEYDLVGGYDFINKLATKSKIPFISANIYTTETGELAFKPYVVLDKNDLRIGIIGVTDFLSANEDKLYKTDYLLEGQKYLSELRDKVDILVVLVNGSINNRNNILDAFKEADYVYLSRTVMNTRTTLEQKDGYPVFYTIGLNGKHLVEVNTSIIDENEPILDVSSSENRIASYARQLIRLKQTEKYQTIEEKYKDSPQILVQIENYEKQVKSLQEKIDSAINTSKVKVVAMPEKMEYNQDMQDFVNNVLDQSLDK